MNMPKLIAVGGLVMLAGAAVAFVAVFVAFAHVPFVDGRPADPRGPIGMVAVSGILLAMIGLPVLLAGVVREICRKEG